MGQLRRRIAAPLVLGALVGSALATTPASSQLSSQLPSLSADQLLAIAHVEAPPAGIGLELHIDFPAEKPLDVAGVEFNAITAVINPDRSVDMQSAVAAESATGAAEADECTDPTFAPTGRSWDAADMPVVWNFRGGSTPPENSKFFTKRSLRQAHHVWPLSESRCTNQDRVDFVYNYGGGTKRTVTYDHKNIVEFGNLSSGALAINYTWFSGTRILETDLRLNRAYSWTNRPQGRNAYQVVNVVTHELGHQLGLDDLSDPHGGLTMFGRIARGELKKTTLGSGDVRGASRLSP